MTKPKRTRQRKHHRRTGRGGMPPGRTPRKPSFQRPPRTETVRRRLRVRKYCSAPGALACVLRWTAQGSAQEAGGALWHRAARAALEIVRLAGRLRNWW
jgi:hypothetical protein